MLDGIVTVHLDGKRYSGAYFFEENELVVTAYDLKKSSADMACRQGERGKAALNFGKLVLIDMVRDAQTMPSAHPGLSLIGSTTHMFCGGSTTQIGF